ncbi:MAG: DNA adenine methylase [Deferribacteraceae bacterium]|jgi:DNA adenine methylase|nr:DNA adenine methylase [Deferribacteraceae bacterium]
MQPLLNEGKPFLKWVGGKSQLLSEIRKRYPATIDRYCEPFIGGGAVFFDIMAHYPIKNAYISDRNATLINTYRVVQKEVEQLISALSEIHEAYIKLDHGSRKVYYNGVREQFNTQRLDGIESAALFIFLNKTCFNGLFRVNKSGLFNVPMGAYKNPLICDSKTLRQASSLLQDTEIHCGDYADSLSFIDEKTFVYIDPPYRPLTKTSSFTSYNESCFDDDEQRRLADFIDTIDKIGCKVVLSNSDPKNVDANDSFFDDLYRKLTIARIPAKRMVNRNASDRGSINELLILNRG